jgi:hypothetical protein
MHKGVVAFVAAGAGLTIAFASIVDANAHHGCRVLRHHTTSFLQDDQETLWCTLRSGARVSPTRQYPAGNNEDRDLRGGASYCLINGSRVRHEGWARAWYRDDRGRRVNVMRCR